MEHVAPAGAAIPRPAWRDPCPESGRTRRGRGRRAAARADPADTRPPRLPAGCSSSASTCIAVQRRPPSALPEPPMPTRPRPPQSADRLTGPRVLHRRRRRRARRRAVSAASSSRPARLAPPATAAESLESAPARASPAPSAAAAAASDEADTPPSGSEVASPGTPSLSLLTRSSSSPDAARCCRVPRPAGDSSPWQGRQDLNLQPAVLETAALPVELRPFAGARPEVAPSAGRGRHGIPTAGSRQHTPDDPV